MDNHIYLSSEFKIEICCSCSMAFAVPVDFEARRRNDHKVFYCPNGHGQHYAAKSNSEILKSQLNYCQSRYDREHSRRITAERSRTALKGVITKLKNERDPEAIGGEDET